jgi:O-antigen/teichoic acid export membrane protein
MAIPFEINRSKIITSIATLFSGSVVAQGMTALALLVTARQLQVEGYGQYAACITISSMFSILFSLGLDVWLLREGGRDPSQIADFAGSVISLKGIIGLVWILLLWFIVPLLNQQSFPSALLHFSLLLLWSDTILATCLTTFKAVLHNKTPAILEATADSLWFGLTVLLIVLGQRQPEMYLRIRVLVSLGALCSALILLFFRFGLRLNLSTVRKALREAFPFASSEFLAMINMRADVVIVSIILGATATGLYSPAVGLINMAFLVPLAVHMVMVPVLSNLFRHHAQQAAKTAFRTIALSLLIGIILSFVFFIFSPWLVVILGPSFSGSIVILKILSWVLLFKCVSYAMAAILVATDQQVNRTNIQMIAALANIGLNLIVVNWLGIQGIACVYVFTEVILLAGYTWYVVRRMRYQAV